MIPKENVLLLPSPKS